MPHLNNRGTTWNTWAKNTSTILRVNYFSSLNNQYIELEHVKLVRGGPCFNVLRAHVVISEVTCPADSNDPPGVGVEVKLFCTRGGRVICVL